MAVFNGVFPILARQGGGRAGLRRGDDGCAARGLRGVPEASGGYPGDLVGAANTRWQRARRDLAREPHPQQAIAQVARDPSEFGAWFRERVKELSGIEVDPAQPPVPELVVDWRA